jgi:hypothetical protein
MWPKTTTGATITIVPPQPMQPKTTTGATITIGATTNGPPSMRPNTTTGTDTPRRPNAITTIGANAA